jgi:catechol-2,3-dioxygenase
MPLRLHHIVVDAHDLPGLARFWTQALGWKVLSERENEIVIGIDENAPVGMCFMPTGDPKTADPEGNEFCVVRPKETLIR